MAPYFVNNYFALLLGGGRQDIKGNFGKNKEK
jgi:hypothetical protein